MKHGKGKKKTDPKWSPIDLKLRDARGYVKGHGTTGAFAAREAFRIYEAINQNRVESGKEPV